MSRIVVVGGGLAGLVVARRLAREVIGAEIFVAERAACCGGLIRTERDGGFVIEAGPDSFLTTKPDALALCDELRIGHELEPTLPHAHRAFIRREDRLLPIPEGMSGLVPIRLGSLFASGVLPLEGFARFVLDLVMPPGPPMQDETVGAFVRRRFGDEAWTWLFEPLLSGIHGGDVDRLSLRATFPALHEAEARSGSVLAGLREAARGRRRDDRDPRTPFTAPAGGMERLIDALLADRGGARVLINSRVVRVESRPDTAEDAGGPRAAEDARRWAVGMEHGGEIAADAIVLAIPARAASDLLRATSSALADTLSAIPFERALVVQLAYGRADCPRPLAGHGYLNPRAGGRPITACTWTSSKFRHRAPPEAVLLRMFVRTVAMGAAGSSDDTDPVRLAREEVRDALGIHAEPLWSRVFDWPDTMPQYTIGHPDRLDAIDHALAGLPGLFLTGNSYRGVGIPDTIRAAESAAARVRSFLAGAA